VSNARKARGAETQRVVAGYFAQNGWPYATDAGAGRNGSDVLGVPGLSIEVKARRDFSPMAWVRQAASVPGLPIVIFRPDGMGVTTLAQWPAMLRLADLVDLLRHAGYGTPYNDTSVPELTERDDGTTVTRSGSDFANT
jgi:hypothetical protein